MLVLQRVANLCGGAAPCRHALAISGSQVALTSRCNHAGAIKGPRLSSTSTAATSGAAAAEGDWPPAMLAMRRFVVSSDAPAFPVQLARARPTLPCHVRLDGASTLAQATSSVVDALAPGGALDTHGAVLLRGGEALQVATEDPQGYSDLIMSLGPALVPMDYVGGAATRHTLAPGIATASDDPDAVTIEPHQELSIAHDWPDVVSFACLAAPHPGEGGETPLTDMRAFTAAIGPQVMEAVQRRGVTYTRCLPSRRDAERWGTEYCWQMSMKTEDPREAEARLEAKGYEWHWGRVLDSDADERLFARWTMPATLDDEGAPQGTLWFNQLTTLHHSYYLDNPSGVAYARSCPEPHHFPSDTLWGDGEAAAAEDIDHFRAELWRASVAHVWRRGDVLLLDNARVAHGRMGFTRGANRRVVASLLARGPSR